MALLYKQPAEFMTKIITENVDMNKRSSITKSLENESVLLMLVPTNKLLQYYGQQDAHHESILQ